MVLLWGGDDGVRAVIFGGGGKEGIEVGFCRPEDIVGVEPVEVGYWLRMGPVSISCWASFRGGVGTTYK